MKAERRHELKENSLVHYLRLTPWIIDKYQSQILLVIVLVALAFVVVRYRQNSAQERLTAAQQSLDLAGGYLHQLKQTIPYGDQLQAAMQQRQLVFSDGLMQTDDVLAKAPDDQPVLKAQALVDKGDLNFEMANFPELPGAATQPALQTVEPRDVLLKDAQTAYSQVVKAYASQTNAVTAAHFGLAAVAEDRAALSNWKDASQWEVARSEYQAILDSSAAPGFKKAASVRMDMLHNLQQPALTNILATPTTVPSISALPGIQGPVVPVMKTSAVTKASTLPTTR